MREASVSSETSGEFPEIGDDDIIADGGTEVMARSALPLASPSLDSAAIAIPRAPTTAPLLDLARDDHEEAPQRKRVEKTQPFNRASIVSALTPTQAAAWQVAPSARSSSIAPMAMNVSLPLDPVTTLPPARDGSNDKPSPVIALAIGGGLALCAAVLVMVAVRLSSGHTTSATSTAAPREAQTVPEVRDTRPVKTAAAQGDYDMPVTSPGALPSAVISTESLPSAPYSPHVGPSRRTHPTRR